jgi:F-type H+-transporting ATPase subunit gamma
MQPLIRLREDLRFAEEIVSMIEILKATTSRQFRILQGKRSQYETFKVRLEEFIEAMAGERITHPFLTEVRHLPKAVVMISSEEGFLGGLNASVINTGLEQAGVGDELIVLGERGARHLSENTKSDFTVLPGLGDEVTYERAAAVRDFLIEKFLSKKIGLVLIAYPRFFSIAVQTPEVTKLLPCDALFQSSEDTRRGRLKRRAVFIEPDRARAVDYLVRAFLLQKIYDMFWESKLAECAARIMHLEGSHQEIMHKHQESLYQYFRHFHEKSDRDIREVFASRLISQEKL